MIQVLQYYWHVQVFYSCVSFYKAYVSRQSLCLSLYYVPLSIPNIICTFYSWLVLPELYFISLFSEDQLSIYGLPFPPSVSLLSGINHILSFLLLPLGVHCVFLTSWVIIILHTSELNFCLLKVGFNVVVFFLVSHLIVNSVLLA